jgi:hypothetical protein
MTKPIVIDIESDVAVDVREQWHFLPERFGVGVEGDILVVFEPFYAKLFYLWEGDL